jgi:peptidyl-prolyl cis-trans isomerase A (cyclophilin A)
VHVRGHRASQKCCVRIVPMPLHTAVATISTSLGDIRVNLLGNHAPKTVRNFTGLATGEIEWTHPGTGKKSNDPLYNGVIFHRIIKQFMLQGGDPLGQGIGGPGFEFDDEIHPELNFNEPYVLAMANAGTRGGKGTNGSQFFITTVPTQWLQGKHTIFGLVADEESKRVVDAIEAVPTDGRDKPLDDVVINSVTITDA